MKYISQYRTQILGVSILWIVLFHSKFCFQIRILDYIQSVGYAGVDIFFFQSGIGLYRSLEKGDDIVNFYKRRVKRLFPSYIPFILIWMIPCLFDNSLSVWGKLQCLFGNLLMTGWLNDLKYQFNWYSQAIWGFYLIVPIIYHLLKKISYKKVSLKNDILLMVALTCFGIPFFGHEILIAVSRIPIFVLGMLFADHSELYWKNTNPKTSKTWKSVLLMGGVVIGFILLLFSHIAIGERLWDYGLWWYPFLLITPGLCVVLGKFFSIINNSLFGKQLISILNIVGGSSFEIYLLHIAIFFYLNKFEIHNNYNWLLISIFSVLLGIFYHGIVTYFIKIIQLKNYRKIEKVIIS